MKISSVRDLKKFIESLPENQLDLPIYFDTEAKKFNYHLAKIGLASLENDYTILFEMNNEEN